MDFIGAFSGSAVVRRKSYRASDGARWSHLSKTGPAIAFLATSQVVMKYILLIVLGILSVTAARADILQLRDGRMFTGEFLGATRDQIFFQADSPAGIVGPAAYSTAEVESLTFGPAPKQSSASNSSKAPRCYTRGSREPQKSEQTPAQ